MAKLSVLKGATSVLVRIFLQDSSSATGAGLAGLVFNSAGLTCYRMRDDDGNAGATAISLATATLGTWATGGFKEKDATNAPGWYEFGIPNAALATGSRSVSIHFKGATNLAPLPLEIELTGWDNQDAVHGGMSALPNTACTTNASLLTSGTGTAQISVSSGQVILQTGTGTGQLDFTSGVVKANATQWLGGTIPAVNVTGVPLVDAKYLLGTIFATPATAGIPDVNVKNINNVAAATPGASGGMLIAGSNSGTTTLAALTVTGTFTVSDGFVVNRSTGNSSACVWTGNGTGHGLDLESGSGATGDGLHSTSNATDGNGVTFTGHGGGAGMKNNAGATGHGTHSVGGASSGAGGLFTVNASGNPGLKCLGAGTGAGLLANGGLTGPGFSVVAGATSGDGFSVTTTNGDGIKITSAGSGKHDINLVGDGTIHGTIDTVTTLTNLPAITAGWLTATGIAADAITAAKVADGTIDAATFAAGAINAASIASNAITAAKVATDAIGAAQLAADAVTEIQSGLSTLTAANVRTAVGLASANLDTQLAAIQSDTDDVQTRLPAALTGDGNIKADTLRVGGTLQTAGDIIGDTNDIQSRLPAALSNGFIKASVQEIDASLDAYTAKVWVVVDDTGAVDHWKADWFRNGEPVASGITSPTIRVYDTSGVDLIATTAMTAISGEATLMYDASTTARMVSGAVYNAKVVATIGGSSRTATQPIGRDKTS